MSLGRLVGKRVRLEYWRAVVVLLQRHLGLLLLLQQLRAVLPAAVAAAADGRRQQGVGAALAAAAAAAAASAEGREGVPAEVVEAAAVLQRGEAAAGVEGAGVALEGLERVVAKLLR